IPGGYGAVYAELRALETLGLCRRGYFVEGLGGAQFALGGAVERIRELRERGEDADALVLGAADPAQPYGAALPWPRRAGARAARVAGAHVVLLGGEAVLFVERGGRSLVPLRDPDHDWLRAALEALVAHVRRGGVERLAVERASTHAGRPGAARCTANPRVWFVEGSTASVFLCAVRTGGATCDRYLVRRHGRRYAVRLRQRATDCVLPAG